jgi:hypothetical protein
LLDTSIAIGVQLSDPVSVAQCSSIVVASSSDLNLRAWHPTRNIVLSKVRSTPNAVRTAAAILLKSTIANQIITPPWATSLEAQHKVADADFTDLSNYAKLQSVDSIASVNL